MSKKLDMMKRYVLPGILAVNSLGAIGARVIDNPYYRMSSSTTFCITKVEINDSTTRVYTDIYGQPGYWISAGENFTLKGADTGNEYALKSIEGIPMNEKVWLPDSAYMNAVFVFPPLAAVDTVIDFNEGDESFDGWKVTGLQLGAQPAGIRTHITGSLEGRPEVSWLVLAPAGDDVRVNKTLIVPVRNGRFEYTLTTDEILAYDLVPGIDILNGSWMMSRFFSEGGDVHIEIPANDKMRATLPIHGGSLTQHLCDMTEARYRHILESGINELEDSLDRTRSMYTPEYYALTDFLDQHHKDITESQQDSIFKLMERLNEDDRVMSEVGKEYRALGDKVYQETALMSDEFIRNDTTLAGLYMIYEKMKFNQPGFKDFLPVFTTRYKDRFRDHKYTKALSALLSDESATPGHKVPDFMAPDLDGNDYTLSQLIEGKIALVDLWASWCGPCRRHSIAMIPVYEKWKDRGFTVIGVARENTDTNAMRKAIEQDGYPWVNLVELNDSAHIWERYGAGNAGGIQVLVGKDGMVVAVNPTPEDVEAYLQQASAEE